MIKFYFFFFLFEDFFSSFFVEDSESSPIFSEIPWAAAVREVIKSPTLLPGISIEPVSFILPSGPKARVWILNKPFTN